MLTAKDVQALIQRSLQSPPLQGVKWNDIESQRTALRELREVLPCKHPLVETLEKKLNAIRGGNGWFDYINPIKYLPQSINLAAPPEEEEEVKAAPPPPPQPPSRSALIDPASLPKSLDELQNAPAPAIQFTPLPPPPPIQPQQPQQPIQPIQPIQAIQAVVSPQKQAVVSPQKQELVNAPVAPVAPVGLSEEEVSKLNELLERVRGVVVKRNAVFAHGVVETKRLMEVETAVQLFMFEYRGYGRAVEAAMPLLKEDASGVMTYKEWRERSPSVVEEVAKCVRESLIFVQSLREFGRYQEQLDAMCDMKRSTLFGVERDEIQKSIELGEAANAYITGDPPSDELLAFVRKVAEERRHMVTPSAVLPEESQTTPIKHTILTYTTQYFFSISGALYTLLKWYIITALIGVTVLSIKRGYEAYYRNPYVTRDLADDIRLKI